LNEQNHPAIVVDLRRRVFVELAGRETHLFVVSTAAPKACELVFPHPSQAAALSAETHREVEVNPVTWPAP
jgi:hypothetical protein